MDTDTEEEQNDVDDEIESGHGEDELLEDVSENDIDEDLNEDDGDVEIDPEVLRLLEAVLFASAEPLMERALVARLPEGCNLKALLRQLKEDYALRGVNLVKAGKSWAFRTAPDLSQKLTMEVEVGRKLSRASIETLAIMSYHQPVTRAEVEEIRGVSLSRGTIDVLFEAGWIKPRGRRQTPGRPMTWGTTDAFLDHFGLESIRDLPGVEELKATGMLDSRPAINAYRVTGEFDRGEAPVDAEDGPPPSELFENEGEVEPEEPLDPDGS